jgi:hypothetical protein
VKITTELIIQATTSDSKYFSAKQSYGVWGWPQQQDVTAGPPLDITLNKMYNRY